MIRRRYHEEGRIAGSGGSGQCKAGSVVPYKCNRCGKPIKPKGQARHIPEACKTCLRRS